jgi:hypothetical protein
MPNPDINPRDDLIPGVAVLIKQPGKMYLKIIRKYYIFEVSN